MTTLIIMNNLSLDFKEPTTLANETDKKKGQEPGSCPFRVNHSE